MGRRTIIIFGPPGTGKTQHLIGRVEEHYGLGVEPGRLGYVSFTRRAAYEARDRALTKFNLSVDQVPWFSTLHSIAFRRLRLLPSQIMQPGDWVELGNMLGPYDFVGAPGIEQERAVNVTGGLGDRCLFIYSYAKSKMISIEQAWHDIAVRSRRVTDIPLPVLRRFVDGLTRFKEAREMYDFTDLLDAATDLPELDVLIIDEGQDLTPQQWEFARRLGRSASLVYVAGDDDQAIYDWTGSDSSMLFKLLGERHVLPHSHRLPRRFAELAQRWAARIHNRQAKEWDGRADEGELTWVPDVEYVDLSSGSWLLLARTRYLLRRLETHCRRQGVVYEVNGQWSNQHSSCRAVRAYEALRQGRKVPTPLARYATRYARSPTVLRVGGDVAWEDITWPFEDRPPWYEVLDMGTDQREYVRGLLRRGESLSQPGRVVISTIHGAKGGEADNVVLLSDTTRRLAQEQLADEELRVWYVGLTRARERMFLVKPRGSIYFPLDV